MAKYKIRLVRVEKYYRFSESLVPDTFDSLTKARAKAIQYMENDPTITSVEVSNPKYMNIWQVSMKVKRTDNRKGYYWYAMRPNETVGAGHYINKDGSISKKPYMYYAKEW